MHSLSRKIFFILLQGLRSKRIEKYVFGNPRVGRFFAVDPLAKKYSFQSPYAFATNNPVHLVDVDGLGTNENEDWVETKEGKIEWRDNVTKANDPDLKQEEKYLGKKGIAYDEDSGYIVQYNEDGTKTKVPTNLNEVTIETKVKKKDYVLNEKGEKLIWDNIKTGSFTSTYSHTEINKLKLSHKDVNEYLFNQINIHSNISKISGYASLLPVSGPIEADLALVSLDENNKSDDFLRLTQKYYNLPKNSQNGLWIINTRKIIFNYSGGKPTFHNITNFYLPNGNLFYSHEEIH